VKMWHPPDLCAGVALLLLLGTSMAPLMVPSTIGTDPAPLQGADYERPVSKISGVQEAHWERPPGQSAGEEWIFEVFTPPIIYYHSGTQQFALTPPSGNLKEEPFGLDLQSVDHELYRLQYAGYLGEEGRYVVEIRDMETQTYFRGKVGARFPEAEFSIKDFVVNAYVVQPQDSKSTPHLERVIQLVIWDERSAKSIVLTQEPLIGEFPIVVVKDQYGAAHRVRSGECFTSGDAVFTLLDADPAAGSARFRKDPASGVPSETVLLRQAPP